MNTDNNMLLSYLRIRKIIGLLGLVLPIAIVIIHKQLLPSISLYYYTKSSVIFIGILSAFGLFLIAYKGHKYDKTTELISDNVITHIAGISILLVVLIPTSCTPGEDFGICIHPFPENYPLFGHYNQYVRAIHLSFAALFFYCMGWISALRFSKGKQIKKNILYKTCGYIVWSCLGLLILEFIFRTLFDFSGITAFDVYILETIGIIAFGIAWLVKGQVIEDLLNLKSIFTK